MKRTEFFWLLGTGIFAIILNYLVFDLGSWKPGLTIDINVHDTYFVLPVSIFVVFVFNLIFFGIYLVRILWTKFKNKVVNIIFLIANILLILKLTQLISIFNGFAQAEEIGPTMVNLIRTFSDILFAIQILLLVLMIFSSVKTGINYKRSE